MNIFMEFVEVLVWSLIYTAALCVGIELVKYLWWRKKNKL